MSVMDPLAASYFTSEQVETIFTFLTHLHCMWALEESHVSYFCALHHRFSPDIQALVIRVLFCSPALTNMKCFQLVNSVHAKQSSVKKSLILYTGRSKNKANNHLYSSLLGN